MCVFRSQHSISSCLQRQKSVTILRTQLKASHDPPGGGGQMAMSASRLSTFLRQFSSHVDLGFPAGARWALQVDLRRMLSRTAECFPAAIVATNTKHSVRCLDAMRTACLRVGLHNKNSNKFKSVPRLVENCCSVLLVSVDRSCSERIDTATSSHWLMAASSRRWLRSPLFPCTVV